MWVNWVKLAINHCSNQQNLEHNPKQQQNNKLLSWRSCNPGAKGVSNEQWGAWGDYEGEWENKRLQRKIIFCLQLILLQFTKRIWPDKQKTEVKQDCQCKWQRLQAKWRRQGKKREQISGGSKRETEERFWLNRDCAGDGSSGMRLEYLGLGMDTWHWWIMGKEEPVRWGRGLWLLPQEWAREDTQDSHSLSKLCTHSKIPEYPLSIRPSWRVCLLSMSSKSRRVSQVHINTIDGKKCFRAIYN